MWFWLMCRNWPLLFITNTSDMHFYFIVHINPHLWPCDAQHLWKNLHLGFLLFSSHYHTNSSSASLNHLFFSFKIVFTYSFYLHACRITYWVVIPHRTSSTHTPTISFPLLNVLQSVFSYWKPFITYFILAFLYFFYLLSQFYNLSCSFLSSGL